MSRDPIDITNSVAAPQGRGDLEARARPLFSKRVQRGIVAAWLIEMLIVVISATKGEHPWS